MSDENKLGREFFINKHAFKNEVTPWSEPVGFQSFSVCTTIDCSPGNSFHVIEYSAYQAALDKASAAEAKYDELKSYLPKVPTQPYEKELAKRCSDAEAKITQLEIYNAELEKKLKYVNTDTVRDKTRYRPE